MTISNATYAPIFSKENAGLKLQTQNYRIVKTVEGTATATYIFGFGGLSDKAKTIYASSHADMVANARLKPNQAIINIITERRINASFYPLFSRQIIHTTGTVIEFQETLNSQTKTPAAYKVGDIYSLNGGDYVVVQVNDDGKHGKIIYTNNTMFHIWDTANSISSYLGKEWRLPSIEEMKDILGNLNKINNALSTITQRKIVSGSYWCQNETDAERANIVSWNEISYTVSKANKASAMRYIAVSEF